MIVPGFLDLPSELTDYQSSRVVILPVPYDSTTCYRPGARLGPGALIEASRQVETYDEELRYNPAAVGICTLDELEPEMAGPEAMVERIYQAVREHLANDKWVLTLGGEHTLTLGAVRAHLEDHPGLSVLQVDAHLDLRESYQGTPFSHACVMRRVHELEGRGSYVQVGIRSQSEEEARFVTGQQMRPYYARELMDGERWMKGVVKDLGERVYVTIDLDGLDPSVVPGVSTPEPGGLSWYQVTGLLRQVGLKRKIVGGDIMELAPIPGQVHSEFTAARLACKLLASALAP